MTTFTEEVRDLVSPHKFGGSRRTAALYLISLDGGLDEQTGDVDWDYWCGRCDRDLLFVDTQGFCWHEHYAGEQEAKIRFEQIEQEYDQQEDTE